jgi:hypothetical protein
MYKEEPHKAYRYNLGNQMKVDEIHGIYYTHV